MEVYIVIKIAGKDSYMSWIEYFDLPAEVFDTEEKAKKFISERDNPSKWICVTREVK